jgi:transcriptional regulator with XRE-family HTH domain
MRLYSVLCLCVILQIEIPRGGWMELGERIAVLREEQALTQAELAETARISPSTLSQIESGRVPRPHVGTVRKIARALGVEPAELRRAREPAVPLADAPKEAGQLDHEHAVMLRELLENARKIAQPIIEQDDQTIAAARQALARMKGGIGVSDAYFVEESPEQPELGATVVDFADYVLAREQQHRKTASSR